MDSKRKDFLNEHQFPVTRRQFMALGLAGGYTAYSYFGTGSFLFQKAIAGEKKTYCPFLVIDLAGGAGLPGNFLVGGKGGPEDLLSSYSSLGWNPRNSVIDRRFGLPMAGGATPQTSVSKILQGILETLSVEAQAKLRMGSLINTSRDDTGENPLSAIHLIAQAGLKGEKISKGFGLRNNVSGGNSKSPDIAGSDSLKPVFLTDLIQLETLAGPSKFLKRLSSRQSDSLKEVLRNLARSQVSKSTSRNSSELSAHLDSAFGEFAASLGEKLQFDPRTDAVTKKVFGITEATSNTDRNALVAASVWNTIRGLAGGSSITVDGCDYHDGTQTTGDAKDLEIGRLVGRSFELAHQLKRPLFVQMITDGGVYSNDGTRNWQGDSSERTMTVLAYYKPDQAPEYFKKDRTQIGHYLSGQGVDRQTLLGDNPARVAYATLVNYLQISGTLGDHEEELRAFFTKEEMESILIFGS